MKDMKYYFRFLMLALCISLVACDNDDDSVKPVFPELQKIECAVNDEKTLTFDASSDWTLTSSALWCSFVVDGEQTFSCSGGAGAQSVTIHISNDATELMKSYKAELTLMIRGEKQVIFTVTRPMTGYELHVFNADQTVEYTNENPLIKTYQKDQVFVVAANADWVVEPSEGLTLEGTYGEAGDNVKVKASLKAGYTKEAWEQKLVFKNKKNEVVVELPVKYDGIPADKIEFDRSVGTSVKYSYDGYSYTLNSEEFAVPLSVQIAAKDDKFTWVYVDYTKELDQATWEYVYTFDRMSEDDSWFWVDKNSSDNISVNVTGNQGKERTGYLMIFPNAVYDAIKNDFEAKVFDTSEGIVKEYWEYVALDINQVANIKFTIGFQIADVEGNPLSDGEGGVITSMLYSETGGELSDEQLVEKYGTANVSILSLPGFVDYEAIMFTPNGYTGYYFEVDSYFGGKNTIWSGVEVSGGQKSGMITGLMIGVNGEKEMVLTVINNGDPYAVLLVQPRY